MPLSEHNVAASFRAICNNANAALFVLDDNQHCIYINPAGEEMTGYGLKELSGKPLHDVLHHILPDGKPCSLEDCHVHNAFPAKEREQGEDVFIHSDGTFYPVAYTASPIIESGSILGTVVEARSLVEERKNQSKQARERALLASTFENAAMGMVHVGLDGAFIRTNQKLCDITGYDREELLNLSFRDITHPDDQTIDTELFRQLKNGDRNGYNIEKRYYCKNGEIIWVNLTISAHQDEIGEILFYIMVVEDITDIKEYQHHLEIMTGELNHRIKNTLAIVQAIASMSLPKDTKGKEAFMERLHTLSRSHDLLVADHWAGSNIKAVIKQAIHPFGGIENARISASGPEHILEPRSAVALSMAINELGTNALKYGALSNEDGHISMSWEFDSQDDSRALKFTWAENGGPKVTVPKSRGFGTNLIERALASTMREKPKIEFNPDGVRFRCYFNTD